jgi:hypothetical protein
VRVCNDCKRINAGGAGSGASGGGAGGASVAPSGSFLGEDVRSGGGGGGGDALGGGDGGGVGGSEGPEGLAVEGEGEGLGGEGLGGGGGAGDEDGLGLPAAGGGGGGRAGGSAPVCGLGLFDDRGRLRPPSAPFFNRPSTAVSEGALHSIASVADSHLEWVVRRGVHLLFPHLAAPASSPHCLSQGQEEWVQVLLGLARRCSTALDPNIRAGDRADVRALLKVKVLPLGTPMLSSATLPALSPSPQLGVRVGPPEVISGVVFRGGLPNKGMRDALAAPRVLLLDDGLRFDVSGTGGGSGGSGGDARLSSLDTLIEQEREYTSIIVAKVQSLRPHVLLCSGTASILAQELLRSTGVSMVPGVSAANLARLSRAAGARVLPGINYIDKLVEGDIVGTGAGYFRALGGGSSSGASGASRDSAAAGSGGAAPGARLRLVVVEGCPPHTGCTVLLRGHREDAGPAKALLRHAVWVGRCLRLWASFLFDSAVVVRPISQRLDEFRLQQQQQQQPLSEAKAEALEVILESAAMQQGRVPPLMAASMPHFSQDLRSKAGQFLLALPPIPRPAEAIHMLPGTLPRAQACSSRVLALGPSASALPAAPRCASGASSPAGGVEDARSSTALAAAAPETETTTTCCLSGTSATYLPPLAPAEHLEAMLRASSPTPFSHLPHLPLLLPAAAAAAAGAGAAHPLLPSPVARVAGATAEVEASISVTAIRLQGETRVQCCKPKVHTLHYYGSGDTALGAFLETQCFGLEGAAGAAGGGGGGGGAQPCSGCKKGPSAHVLSFLHGRGRLDITVHKLSFAVPLAPLSSAGASSTGVGSTAGGAASPSGGGGGGDSAGAGAAPSAPHTQALPLPPPPGTDIVTWAFCKACKCLISPSTRLSRGAWSFSFGCLLDCYLTGGGVGGDFFSPLASTCPHNPFSSHLRYFGKGRRAAMFKFTPISPLLLKIPLLPFSHARGPASSGLSSSSTAAAPTHPHQLAHAQPSPWALRCASEFVGTLCALGRRRLEVWSALLSSAEEAAGMARELSSAILRVVEEEQQQQLVQEGGGEGSDAYSTQQRRERESLGTRLGLAVDVVRGCVGSLRDVVEGCGIEEEGLAASRDLLACSRDNGPPLIVLSSLFHAQQWASRAVQLQRRINSLHIAIAREVAVVVGAAEVWRVFSIMPSASASASASAALASAPSSVQASAEETPRVSRATSVASSTVGGTVVGGGEEQEGGSQELGQAEEVDEAGEVDHLAAAAEDDDAVLDGVEGEFSSPSRRERGREAASAWKIFPVGSGESPRCPPPSLILSPPLSATLPATFKAHLKAFIEAAVQVQKGARRSCLDVVASSGAGGALSPSLAASGASASISNLAGLFFLKAHPALAPSKECRIALPVKDALSSTAVAFSMASSQWSRKLWEGLEAAAALAASSQKSGGGAASAARKASFSNPFGAPSFSPPSSFSPAAAALVAPATPSSLVVEKSLSSLSLSSSSSSPSLANASVAQVQESGLDSAEDTEIGGLEADEGDTVQAAAAAAAAAAAVTAFPSTLSSGSLASPLRARSSSISGMSSPRSSSHHATFSPGREKRAQSLSSTPPLLSGGDQGQNVGSLPFKAIKQPLCTPVASAQAKPPPSYLESLARSKVPSPPQSLSGASIGVGNSTPSEGGGGEWGERGLISRSKSTRFIPLPGFPLLSTSTTGTAATSQALSSLPLSGLLSSPLQHDIVHTFSDRVAVQCSESEGPWMDAGSSVDSRLASFNCGTFSSFTVTSHWATHFYALRALVLGEREEGPGASPCPPSRMRPSRACNPLTLSCAAATHASFFQSLAMCDKWQASGGNSGARFERSSDGRFVTKIVSQTEYDMFVGHIAPSYFAHLLEGMEEGAPSALVKILGAFKVVVTTEEIARGGRGGVSLPSSSSTTKESSVGDSAASRAAGVSYTGSSAAAAASSGEGGANGGSSAGAGPTETPASPSGTSVPAQAAQTAPPPPGPIQASPATSGVGSSVAAPRKLLTRLVRQTTQYLLVLENLFFERNIDPGMTFDLKGKMRAQKKEVPVVQAQRSSTVANSNTGQLMAAGRASQAAESLVEGQSSQGGGGGAASADNPFSVAPHFIPPPLQAGGDAGEFAPKLNVLLPSSLPLAPAQQQVQQQQQQPQVVLLDGDLLELTKGFPVSLTEEAKRVLDTALRRDTAWLASQSIVDYSLLIGLESADGGKDPFRGSGGVLHCGIIDYVRRYDIVKRLENQVKAVTALATNVEPTVVEPNRYSERLLESVDKYLTGAPSRWR